MWIYPFYVVLVFIQCFNVLVCNQDTINVVLCYLCTHIVADFLLVNIYTLVKWLRDRELGVCVSGNVA